MADNDNQVVDRVREFDQYLKERIEDINRRLDDAGGGPTYDRIKTRRGEAAIIHAAFREIFSGWL